ncbi:hypothetical protein MA16_Dca027882 [Dendrobium catenatum]|uniref:Uncharacterized protein n=1 Tax=Dendrobium catenatum TaxID=906689 RepID=A0A2I0VN82_9ASPA|nr:hypothetical protein MA16_Dca027882 [Dendrobium catenatum]
MHAFVARSGKKNHGRGVLERGNLPCTPLLRVVGKAQFSRSFPLNGGDAGRLPKFQVKYYYTWTCFETQKSKSLDSNEKEQWTFKLD